MKTAWQLHKEKWGGGCGSCQCEGKRVVLGRGTLPCDIAFVGEAPGESEDVLGLPMVGPAGTLLDRIIADSFKTFPSPRIAFTNIVGCIPRDGSNKMAEPDEAQIKSCETRLMEFLVLCHPRLKMLVRVGKLSEKWCPLPENVVVVDIVHPALILRSNESNRGLMVQRCVVQLRDAWDEAREKRC